jgi:hypothetical protein
MLRFARNFAWDFGILHLPQGIRRFACAEELIKVLPVIQAKPQEPA